MMMGCPSLMNMIPNGGRRISLLLARRNRHMSMSKQCTSRHYSTALFERPCSIARDRKVCMTVEIINRQYMKTRSSDGKLLAETEEAARNRKLELSTVPVTATSSVRHIFGEIGDRPEPEEDDVDMVANLKSEASAIKETFSLSDAPKEAFYIGLAGVAPYLATSVSTWYCAWEVKNEFGFLISRNSAEALLHILEPLQIGYGAVILSCLGTIHWGLEWGGFGGHHGFRRYIPGVIAPAIAWPTTLLPIEHALIAQFIAFNFLYYYDTRATRRGWAPSWYNNYRFVLTFVVGASIVISLIGRGQIADQIGNLPAPMDRIKALREAQSENLEREEKARRANEIAEEEKEEEEDN